MRGRGKITLLPAPPSTGQITASSAITHKRRPKQECPTVRLGHTRSVDCWCKPEVRTAVDGVTVVVHRHAIDLDALDDGDAQK